MPNVSIFRLLVFHNARNSICFGGRHGYAGVADGSRYCPTLTSINWWQPKLTARPFSTELRGSVTLPFYN
ncbi:MAG: hypothetical protein DMF74_24890 [Acidobacteria bacterium]|nr:MAG: hypothetical protein DMF74_24890 [Acidobacteriota bacterium]